MTQTGSPDPRNDRICITSSCPRQFVVADFLRLYRQRARLPEASSAYHHGPSHIFAAIDAHRAAWAELSAAKELSDVPADELADAELTRLNEAVDFAAGKLLDIIPTTIAGTSALLAYAAEHASGGNVARRLRGRERQVKLGSHARRLLGSIAA